MRECIRKQWLQESPSVVKRPHSIGEEAFSSEHTQEEQPKKHILQQQECFVST